MRALDKLMRAAGAFLLLAIVCGTATAQNAKQADAEAAARRERMNLIQKLLTSDLNKLNERLTKDPNNVNPRELTNAALLVLQSHGPALSAEMAMRKVFSAQNLDPASKGYGTVPWLLNDPAVKDANAIEFAMQPMGAILLGYADRLSDSFKKDTRKNIGAALVAVGNHKVKVTYTNIFLMNTVNTILLSQYLGDRAALQRGHRQMQEWMDYTAQNGIDEYGSPTYYGVTMTNLVLGYTYTADSQVKHQFKDALDLFWRDISANYLAKAGHLAGAHSRDYSFLTGTGGVELYLYMEGLVQKDRFTDSVNLLENERPSGYRPSAEIKALSALPERVVEARWQSNPLTARYTYLTQNFAIGTASGNYGPQDKLFAADLTGSHPLVSITLVPDMFDSPYGVLKAKDRSGHFKVNHLPTHMSAVQEKGTALMVLDLDPNNALSDSVVKGNSFATNLVLPAHADELILDGNPVKVSSSLNQAAELNSVVGVREGTSCFATRFFYADSLNDKATVFALKADEVGLGKGAIRFVAYHSSSSLNSTNTDHLHVGVVAMAIPCADTKAIEAGINQLREAKLEAGASGDKFTATATVGNTRLELTEDLQSRLPIQKKVNGAEVSSPIFAVNGKSMALPSAPAQDPSNSASVR